MIEITIIIAIGCLAVYQLITYTINIKKLERANHQLCSDWINMRQDMVDKWNDERKEWTKERQQLLDRIQAGSFAEYKTQEVRVIKAQTAEKETPKLEQL